MKCSEEQSQTDRNQAIDTARGFAVILLVSFHAIGGSPASGLRMGDEFFWRSFADFLALVRMPLFAFIAGYTYGLRPLDGDIGRFVNGKARRLLLPMLVVGTVFAILQSIVPGSNGSIADWRTLHVLPVGQYWFLESLFLIFLVIVICEFLGFLSAGLPFSIVLVLSIAAHVFNYAPHNFGLFGAFRLLPFFLCGLACSRFAFRKAVIWWILVVLCCMFIYILTSKLGYLLSQYLVALVSIALGASIGFAILCSEWQVKWLASIGATSYAIFLFHPFFTAAGRITMYRFGYVDKVTLVVGLTVIGIIGPIIVKRVLQRSAALSFFLVGDSWQFPRNDLRPQYDRLVADNQTAPEKLP